MAFTNTAADRSGVDDRFGYVEKGTFRNAYGNEMFVLVTAAISTFILYVMIGLAIYIPMMEYGVLFAALVCLIPLALLIFTFACVYSFVTKGKEGQYYADSVKFVVTCAGKKEIFYYEEVQHVGFELFSLLGNPRGYIVSIVTRKGTFSYKYISPKHKRYGNPEDTPFYILKRKSEWDTTPEKLQIKYSEQDLERPVAPMLYSNMDNVVSAHEPVPEEYAPKRDYVSSPVAEEDFTVKKGSFRTPYSKELYAYIVIILVFVIGIIIGVSITMTMYAGLTGKLGNVTITAIFCVVWFLIVGTVFNIVSGGKDVKYESTIKEFRITDSDREQIIYMCDVERVEYLPMKTLWFDRGYKVKIITKYTTFEYGYLFLRNRKFMNTADTPFSYIEEQIGTREKYHPSFKRSE